MSTQNSTTVRPRLWATLQARDAAALIAFYTEAFGFTATARHHDAAGRVAHAELLWPEGAGGIMLGDHTPEREWSREPGTAGCYVVTADPDALYARVTDHGADIVRPLNTTDYGSREFVVRDPEGNLWSFGDHPGE
ncbi:VOC family protein [Nocardiopsis sp. CC223A]|uniref:VOC family protein n=1 Tax=Nocardiopsis sp. CC223A TaxID=3044051 RepID=UPI00278BC848|nr:VOC family protein [Nocardiopsis sp. CC223A]